MNLPTAPTRLLRWYASPSGILLAFALALLAASFASDDLRSAAGVVGVLALAAYFPYRSLRERQSTNDGFDKVRDNLSRQDGLLTSDRANGLRRDAEAADLVERLCQLAQSVAGLDELTNGRFREVGSSIAELIAATTTLETAREKLEAAGEKLEAAGEKNEQALAAFSGVMSGRSYLPFSRAISSAESVALIDYWEDRLGITIVPRDIRYLERKFIFAEGLCDGRVATTSTDMLIRCLVGRSVTNVEKPLKVLEIGTLFGLGSLILYQALYPLVDSCMLTLLDPLEGYYGNDTPDPATGVRVTEEVLWSNCDRLAINRDYVRVLKGYSTDPEILDRAVEEYDLIVIDGDHSYDGVRVDFELYAGFLRVGGLLIIDDYNGPSWPDVTLFTDQVIRKDERFEFVGAQSTTGVFRRIQSR